MTESLLRATFWASDWDTKVKTELGWKTYNVMIIYEEHLILPGDKGGRRASIQMRRNRFP